MGSIVRSARKIWRRLTSMRTALVLLFLLALAAVPGSLLPQRPLNPAKVQTYLQTHGVWGKFLDHIGAFDVFGSVWFTAIYLLLFVSLVGCIIPRVRVYAKALAAKPIAAPKNLSRLAENTRLDSPTSPDRAAEIAVATLRPRWRTTVREEAGGALAVSAEKGYSREAGNLVFHISLLCALVLIAIGRFYSYQETYVVTQGQGFCNGFTPDSSKFGSRVDTTSLPGFCVNLNTFTATYRADGTPAQFNAAVSYQHSPTSPMLHDVIEVNHPLRLAGARVYLLNHGFAPIVTIKRPGQAARVMPASNFLPQDGFLTSEGVIIDQGADESSGNDIALSAIFAPTPEVLPGGVVTSLSPQVKDPILAVLAYKGQTNPDGQPQSVYSLNQSAISSGKLKQVAAANLRQGQSMTLPDGTVVTFTNWTQWATLQVSHDPTQYALLAAAVTMIVGLLGSLAVRRRRLWLRITPAGSEEHAGFTLVEIGGLARTDGGNFNEEFAELADRLRAALNSDSALNERFAEPVGAGKD
jgi:cytochrome c biogenesis protein